MLLDFGLYSNTAAQSGGGGGSTSKFSSTALYPTGEWSLSPDKLTATRVVNTQNNANIYADTAKTSGRFQVTLGNMQTGGSGQGSGVGLTDGTNHGTTFLGFSNGVGYYKTGGIFAQNALLDASTPFTDGDMIEFDFSDGANVVIKKNGTSVFTVNLASAGVTIGAGLLPGVGNSNNASESGQTFVYNPVAW